MYSKQYTPQFDIQEALQYTCDASKSVNKGVSSIFANHAVAN